MVVICVGELAIILSAVQFRSNSVGLSRTRCFCLKSFDLEISGSGVSWSLKYILFQYVLVSSRHLFHVDLCLFNVSSSFFK